MKSVALLSGGLDSLLAAHLAALEDEVAIGLTVHYGQRAADAEITAAAAHARWLHAEHVIIHTPWLARIGDAALTHAETDLPSFDENDLDDAEASENSARAVWVPNRNGLFVNIAAAWAEGSGCEAVVAGFNAEEGATFADNSAAFMQAATDALSYSTRSEVRVISPTVEMTKTEMVRHAVADDLPVHTLHSCYRAGPGHCWECESCTRLKRALKQAGRWQHFQPLLSP